MSTPASTPEIPDVTAPFGGRSQVADLNGPVHYVVFDGPKGDEPPFVLVHGLGGSHVNWVLLGERLARRRTVYALDLGGHGFTRAFHHSPSVRTNAELVRRFIEEVVGEPSVVVGNSMGGLITTLVASRANAPVLGAVLVNPALPAPPFRPDAQARSLGTLLATPLVEIVRSKTGKPMSRDERIKAVLDICIHDTKRLHQGALEAHVISGRAQRGFTELQAAFREAARTMIAALARRRVVRHRLAQIAVPVLLIHGDRDRLVHVAAARWAAQVNPHWRYVEFADVGHVPMLEVPDETAEVIESWYADEVVGGGEGTRAAFRVRPGRRA
ncbi:alpha/beta fold hydrolase [Janibacter sp. GXQ6167]|uniref:alpha/beta fold hydrolase n=1 Tax=Janibacter sp. GXQ6167 TaxID=3240791 RepID=UPI0035243216